MNKNKWYQKLWWLIGIGILVVGSLIDNNEGIDRLLILVFAITIIFFFVWFYSYLKSRGSSTGKSIFLSILITLIIFGILYVLLSWVKCGSSIFYQEKTTVSGFTPGFSDFLRQKYGSPKAYTYCDLFNGF